MSWSETLDWRRWSLANSSGLAVETEEEIRVRLENDAATKRLMETEEKRKARLEKIVATAQVMLALTKGVVYVDMILSLKPILKSW